MSFYILRSIFYQLFFQVFTRVIILITVNNKFLQYSQIEDIFFDLFSMFLFFKIFNSFPKIVLYDQMSVTQKHSSFSNRIKITLVNLSFFQKNTNVVHSQTTSVYKNRGKWQVDDRWCTPCTRFPSF